MGYSILEGAIVGGTAGIVSYCTGEAYWGPIGVISGGITTIGGLGIGGYQGYWQSIDYQDAVNNVTRRYDICKQHCTGGRA
jgi:hypothetical protein